MTADQLVANKALMRRLVRTFETGNLSDVNALIDPDYTDYQGLGGKPVRGPDGFARVVAAARRGFSDLRVTIADLIAEDDRVVARLRWHGTRAGETPMERETIDIVRVAGGRAVEHWGSGVTTLEHKP